MSHMSASMPLLVMKQGILSFKSLLSGQHYPLPLLSPSQWRTSPKFTIFYKSLHYQCKVNFWPMDLVSEFTSDHIIICNCIIILFIFIFLFSQKQANKANPFRATIMVYWLKIFFEKDFFRILTQLACQSKSVVETILFLELTYCLWFVPVTFVTSQQQQTRSQKTHNSCMCLVSTDCPAQG